MQAYETSTTVQGEGVVSIAGVPFEPGTEVEVMISPRRKSAEAFAAAWQRVCCEIRARPGIENLTDDDIQKEIGDHRESQ